MKCTDNKKRRPRRLSKRERRRRALIRLMQRILVSLIIVLAILIGFNLFGNNKDYSADYESKTYNTAYHKEELFSEKLCVVDESVSKNIAVTSETFGLFDVARTDAICSKNVYKKIYPASTTKILTALVALEHADISDMVTVSANASSSSFAWDEATCGILEGDSISLEALLNGLLLHSGNDTAVAIAEHIGGSVEGFAEMMNEKAREVMATHSNFVNPSGLYHDEHYTTVYDLYLIFNECMKHEEFVKIINTDSYSIDVTNSITSEKRTLKWEPTNYYARGLAEAPEGISIIGGKTGTLIAAGNCLILMSEDSSSNPYISVVMGAESRDLLYQDMTDLLSEIPKSE